MSASSTLDRLVDAALLQTARRRFELSSADLHRMIDAADPPRNFAAAVRGPGPRGTGLRVVAELKSRSPSRGPLVAHYDPLTQVAAYERGGAAAVSVLTHEAGFGGSPDHLAQVRAVTDLPLLRKDFVVDEFQVLEARALGADAVLLIVAALPTPRLARLVGLVRGLGMTPLVEVHDEGEVDRALDAGADVIGVNHRDLRDFSIDRTLTARLRARIGDGPIVVGESGIGGREDALTLHAAGADAVLVGETLMRAADPAALLAELVRP